MQKLVRLYKDGLRKHKYPAFSNTDLIDIDLLTDVLYEFQEILNRYIIRLESKEGDTYRKNCKKKYDFQMAYLYAALNYVSQGQYLLVKKRPGKAMANLDHAIHKFHKGISIDKDMIKLRNELRARHKNGWGDLGS